MNLADAIQVFEAHKSEPLLIAGRAVGIHYAGRVTEPYHKLYIPNFPHGEASLRECFQNFKSDIVRAHLCAFLLSTCLVQQSLTRITFDSEGSEGQEQGLWIR